jgi:hypothetical protein
VRNSACDEESSNQLSLDLDEKERAEEKEYVNKSPGAEIIEQNHIIIEPEVTPSATESARNNICKQQEAKKLNPPIKPDSNFTSERKSYFYNDWDRTTWIKIIVATLTLLLIIGSCGWFFNGYITDQAKIARKSEPPPILMPDPPPQKDNLKDDNGMDRQEIQPSPVIMEYELEVYVFEKRAESGNTIVVAEGVTLIFCGEEPEETAIIEGEYNCIAFTSGGEIIESTTVDDSFPNTQGYAFQLTGPVTDFYTDNFGQFYIAISGITAVFPQAPHANMASLVLGKENNIAFTRDGEIIGISQ